jgi:glutathione S-transferase
MADYTFFFNPQSRAQIVRWALHEAGADYDSVLVEWDDKPAALLAANPMGKVPTLIHHRQGGDVAVSEAAAVCHYLAVNAAPDLAPREAEVADYFRWLFFAAAPLEQAVTAKALGWTLTDDQEAMAGFGSLDRVVDALDGWLSLHDYVCGGRFTMADVYVGSAVDWGMSFATLPARDSFTAYRDRLVARYPYRAGKAIDNALIAERETGN